MRLKSAQSRHFLPVLAGIATLAAVGVTAVEVVRTELSHQREAAATLEDHARVAAWKFSNWAEIRLGGRMSRIIRPLRNPELPDDVSAETALEALMVDTVAEFTDCECPQYEPQWAFRRSVGDGAVEGVQTGELPAAVSAYLDTGLTLPADEAGIRIAFAASGDDLFFIAYRRAARIEDAVVGIAGRAPEARRILSSIRAETELLPPSLMSTEDAPEMLAIRVLAGDEEIHADGWGEEPGRYRAKVEMGSSRGPMAEEAMVMENLSVEAEIAPQAADDLLIGGLPQSRIPQLLGLLAIAVLLAAVSVRQVMAERRIAAMRSNAIAGLAHDFRTPLAKIRMFAETERLGRTRDGAESKRALEIVDRESRRLADMVDNVLRFNAAEASALNLSTRDVDPSAFIHDLGEECRMLYPDNRLAVEIDSAVMDSVRVDPDALRRIIMNLVENAAKYAGSGTQITLSLESAPGGVRLAVEDEGPGIPARDRDRIWQRYRRGIRAGKVHQRGEGIGLAVVHDLVMAHRGAVRVEDSREGGARFVVDLPRGSVND